MSDSQLAFEVATAFRHLRLLLIGDIEFLADNAELVAEVGFEGFRNEIVANARAAMAKLKEARRRGIHARTLLPGAIYDNCFEVRRDGDGWVCVMRRGLPDADKDYWERVPAP